jgi:hypothetical protein
MLCWDSGKIGVPGFGCRRSVADFRIEHLSYRPAHWRRARQYRRGRHLGGPTSGRKSLGGGCHSFAGSLGRSIPVILKLRRGAALPPAVTDAITVTSSASELRYRTIRPAGTKQTRVRTEHIGNVSFRPEKCVTRLPERAPRFFGRLSAVGAARVTTSISSSNPYAQLRRSICTLSVRVDWEKRKRPIDRISIQLLVRPLPIRPRPTIVSVAYPVRPTE